MMIVPSTLRAAGVVVLLAACWTAVASNLGFMDDEPITHFTDEDAAMFRQTLTDTLDMAADGEVRRWKNPATRAEGQVKLVKSFAREDLPCRTVTIRNKAKGRSSSMEYSFCKQPTGQWRQAP